MSELDGTRTISIPSLAFNYMDNRLESIGCQGELYYSERVIHTIDSEMMRSGGAKSQYEKLFGTPERAARTWIEYRSIIRCVDCPICHDERGVTCEIPLGICPWVSEEHGYDALLEWLEGETE